MTRALRSGKQEVTDEEAFGGARPETSGEGMNVLLLGSDARDEDELEKVRTAFAEDTVGDYAAQAETQHL